MIEPRMNIYTPRLIVGTMLAVDRPLDTFRGLVSIFSDSVGAVIIAQSEGEVLNSTKN